MFKNRVYVESEKDAPDDAILREGKRGRLYYRPDERGRNSHVGGNKDNSLLEDEKAEIPDHIREADGDLKSKEFEGPEGQEFGDFQGCVNVVEDWDGIDDPDAACAQWHYDDTGEWPGEAEADEQEKIYIGSPDEAPSGAIIERDDNGLFYRQQAYEMARDDYPDEVEDDVEDAGVDLPEAEDADGPD